MRAVAQVQVSEPRVSIEDVGLHLGVAKGRACRWADAKGLLAPWICKFGKFQPSEADDRVRADGANDAQAPAKPERCNSTRKKK